MHRSFPLLKTQTARSGVEKAQLFNKKKISNLKPGTQMLAVTVSLVEKSYSL